MKSIQRKEQSKDGETLSLDDIYLNVQIQLCLKPDHHLESFGYVNQFELFLSTTMSGVFFDTKINSSHTCCGQDLALETAGI